MVVDFKEQSLEFLKKIFFDMLTNIPSWGIIVILLA